MALVVDASVAIKWFIDEPGSGAARTGLVTADRRLESRLRGTSWESSVRTL
jgi:hypothetical protein